MPIFVGTHCNFHQGYIAFKVTNALVFTKDLIFSFPLCEPRFFFASGLVFREKKEN
jgi:hypothetical protein